VSVISSRSQALAGRIEGLARMMRPTPVVDLRFPGVRLLAKLEFANAVGSIKDRAAYWILRRAIERGEIDEQSTLVESSSGNFATALAAYAQLLGLRFVPVIDPNVLPAYESFLRGACETVVKVETPDANGNYLQARLTKVRELCASGDRTFWTNQYGNADGMDAHYHLTADEICRELPHLDFAFIGVSTGGTIAGMSRRFASSVRYSPAVTKSTPIV